MCLDCDFAEHSDRIMYNGVINLFAFIFLLIVLEPRQTEMVGFQNITRTEFEGLTTIPLTIQ